MSKRDEKGRFVKGHSGNNPAALTRSRLRSIATEEELNDVLRSIVDDAKAGDMKAKEWIGNRLVPPLRPEMSKAQFEMDSSSLEKAAGSILQAIADGKISADVGESLMRSLNAAGNVGQMAALSQRIADLESRLQQKPRDITHMVTHEQPEDTPDRAGWRSAVVGRQVESGDRPVGDDDLTTATDADATEDV